MIKKVSTAGGWDFYANSKTCVPVLVVDGNMDRKKDYVSDSKCPFVHSLATCYAQLAKTGLDPPLPWKLP